MPRPPWGRATVNEREGKTQVAKEAKTKKGYAEVVERLEAVVGRLEQGELTLEDSLKSFEEGIRLVRRGEQLLDQAEQRVEELLRMGGEDVAVALETPAAAPPAAAPTRAPARRGPVPPPEDEDDLPF